MKNSLLEVNSQVSDAFVERSFNN